jgi:hypothetical protein
MATIDETNIFAPKDPNTGQTYQLFDADAIKQKQIQSKEQYNLIKEQIKAGNLDQAYEGFTQLPFADQMLLYINPVTGVPLESYEVVKFGAEAQPRFKTFKEFGLDVLDPRKKLFGGVLPSPIKFEDEGSALMSGLAGLGLAGGVFDLATIPKAIISPFVRKAPLYSTRAEGTGGGGGISDIPPQPKRDFAGFVSSVEKQALGPQKFGSGQDLINYLESPRRSGISPKELEYIDFDQIRNNPNLTKEDVVKYIQDNRPQIYRVQRSEDNPTYRADESQNPLNELPFNEEATRIANVEEQAYFRDEYAQEIADHNAILFSNPTLQKSDFVLNSENINNPSVLEDVEKYLKYDPEAFNYVNPDVIEIKYPDGRQPALFNNNDLVKSPEAGGYTINDLQEVVKDGATIEFPALTRNADDIIEEASATRVSPDYGNQIEVYESVGNSGTNYKIIGSENIGYRVELDGEPIIQADTKDSYFSDLADARARVQAEAFDNADIVEGADTFDTGSNADQLLETAPYDVITGEATLPTKYGYQQSNYRLPMGGAENYREFTLHISNPKTATRYDSSKGIKHFGGGDELLHYRTTDRIDEDGKRVLFVEEIQSDLHETAGSLRRSSNYELPKGTIEKTYADIEAIKPKDGEGLLAYRQSKNTEFEFTTPNGEVKTLSPQQIVMIGKRLKGDNSYSITTPDGLYNYLDIDENKIKSFVDMYGKDDALKISNMLEPIVMSGNLPNLPYKGKDWIELAVKDIIKLADEGGYDRVAFTNAPTQIARTNSKVDFVKDASVREIPSIEDYAKSSQFKDDFDMAVDSALYDARKFSNPNITKEELLNQPLNLPEHKLFPEGRYNSDAYKLLNTRGDEIHNFVLDEYMEKVNVQGKLPKYEILKKSTRIENKPDLLYASDSKLADLVPSSKEDLSPPKIAIYPQTTDELLGEFPKKMHEQILKDIEAGNIPKSLDDAQIYELNFKEGSGKKYLDLYKFKLEGALKNVLKKLDKDNKPQEKRVLYSEDNDLDADDLYNNFVTEEKLKLEEAETEGLYGRDFEEPLTHKAITIDITPKMKKTIAEEGVNVYAKGGIVKKLKSMDKPIAGNTRYV